MALPDERPLLSVIIPSFNMEDYLAACCDSLLVEEAWLHRLEVLIVNDGSTDRTSEIAHGYQERFPETFQVIDKENGHYGSCVNRGLRVARGIFVKILDADDTFETDQLTSYLETLEKQALRGEGNVDLVVSDVLTVQPDGEAQEVMRLSLTPLKVTSIRALADSSLYPQMHSIAYRTEMLREIGYRQTEGICYTDAEWAILPMRSVRAFIYFPHVVYRYLVGREGQSMEPSVFRRNFWMVGRIARTLIECYAQEGGTASPDAKLYFKMQVERFLQDYYNHSFLSLPRGEGNNILPPFDDALALLAPNLYHALDKKMFPSRHGFRYIHHWRKRKRAGLAFSLSIRAYSRFARWLYRTRRHFRGNGAL